MMYYGNYPPDRTVVMVSNVVKYLEMSTEEVREILRNLNNASKESTGSLEAAEFPGNKGHVRPEPKTELERVIMEINDLVEEAEAYREEHINQDFRRINASLLELQVTLDTINTTAGDSNARAILKNGIISSENALIQLLRKIHKDYQSCSTCLPL